MSSSTRRIASDGRKRYTHQAYDVTYGGVSPETGADGYNSRLSATNKVNFQITVPADEAATYTFILPPYVYSNAYAVVEAAASGSPVATVTVENIDGTGTKTLIDGASIAAVSTVEQAYETGITIGAQATDQRVSVTVAAPGTGWATIMLRCDIVQTSWK